MYVTFSSISYSQLLILFSDRMTLVKQQFDLQSEKTKAIVKVNQNLKRRTKFMEEKLEEERRNAQKQREITEAVEVARKEEAEERKKERDHYEQCLKEERATRLETENILRFVITV